MLTAQPLSFQYAPQKKSKAEANHYSKWMMEPLEDRSKPAALGLLQVIGSKLISTHKDCKMRGCFRWVLWSVHCFLSQVTSRHHPNKAVCAQDQWPRPGFHLRAETGLSSAGAWPLLDGSTQRLRQMLQPTWHSPAENTCPCDYTYWRKGELAILRKFSPLHSSATAHSS